MKIGLYGMMSESKNIFLALASGEFSFMEKSSYLDFQIVIAVIVGGK